MLMMLACTGKETALTLMIVEIKLTVLMLMMLAATAKRDGADADDADWLRERDGADADDSGRHWRRGGR